MKTIMLVKRREAKIQIVIKSYQAAELIELMTPFFSVEATETVLTNIWTIYSSSALAGSIDNCMHFMEPSPDGPGTNIYFDEVNLNIIVNQVEGRWELLYLLRMVRNIMRWLMWSDNTMYMHGGLIEVQGKGVALIGGKKVGKTSTILSSLGNIKANFISNDDLSIEINENHMIGLGWPRALCIRYDTICQLKNNIPAFYQNLETLKHPSNQYMIDLKKSNQIEHYYFFPKEISGLSDTILLEQISIDYFIFPSFLEKGKVNTASIEKIDQTEIYKRLILNYNELPESYCVFLKNRLRHKTEKMKLIY